MAKKRTSSKEYEVTKFVNFKKTFGDADGSNIAQSSPRATRFFRQDADLTETVEREAFQDKKPGKIKED